MLPAVWYQHVEDGQSVGDQGNDHETMALRTPHLGAQGPEVLVDLGHAVSTRAD